MNRRRYVDGALYEEWDDATQTYRRYNTNGSLAEQRAYTSDEIAGILGLGGVEVTADEVLMRDDNGEVLFSLGPQTHGDRGVSVFRDDGTIALAVRKNFSNTPQVIQISDADGYVILGEESLGNGLARPHLHVPMHPVMATATTLQHGPWGPEVPVTSGTFVTTHQAWWARHNQYGRFNVRIAASDITTSAEVQVINANDGTPLGAFLAGAWTGTRATGSTGYTEVVSPSIFMPSNPEDRVSVALQVRRSAGAGTLRVALPESHG